MKDNTGFLLKLLGFFTMEAQNVPPKDVRFSVICLCVTFVLMTLIIRFPQIIEAVR